MEEAKMIDLSQWEKFGEGGVGQSFIRKDDPALILKLNVEGWPVERTYEEYHVSDVVHRMGLPSPEIYDFVTDGKRYGYIAQRITGKKSFSRLVADNKAGVEDVARRLAAHARHLHSTQCDTAAFTNKIVAARQYLDSCDCMPEDAKALLDGFYAEFDLNAATCMHGDLQPGNMITADGKDYWIDLGAFGYGDPYYDLGNLYFMEHYLPPQMLMDLFHFRGRTLKKFCKAFYMAYFGEENFEEGMKRVRNSARFRAGLCIAAKPSSASLFLPVIRGQKFRFMLIHFLSRFVKASVG